MAKQGAGGSIVELNDRSMAIIQTLKKEDLFHSDTLND